MDLIKEATRKIKKCQNGERKINLQTQKVNRKNKFANKVIKI